MDFYSKISSSLDPSVAKEWAQLLVDEHTQKKRMSRGGGKAGKHVTENNFQKARDAKREFLKTLPQEQKLALEVNKDMERLKACEKSAIVEDGSGEMCPLVDIGINVQNRTPYDEIVAQLRRASCAGVKRVIFTGCDIASMTKGEAFCSQWYKSSKEVSHVFPSGGQEKVPGIEVAFTAGVHPHNAKSFNQGTEELLKKLFESPYCCAVGECGLDYDRMFSPMEKQKEAFEKQLQLAVQVAQQRNCKVPVFTHVRDRDTEKGPPLGATGHAIEILSKYSDHLKVVVHCFTGNAEELKCFVDAGYFIGLTGFIGKKKAEETGTIDAIKNTNLPLERLMLETDAPFMMPHKQWLTPGTGFEKTRNNESATMPAVCRAVATNFQNGKYTAQQVAKQTTANALNFFNMM